ncbi:hypothetical protein [Rhizobium sp. AN80A]|uniref:hypothetical protein n=1 Tax=Rhizobium sp. AN80A TaxID=3040673 RepID=UPI0024B34C5E|nr:hypothetical protein [Rhizobium sp. AN80A]
MRPDVAVAGLDGYIASKRVAAPFDTTSISSALRQKLNGNDWISGDLQRELSRGYV